MPSNISSQPVMYQSDRFTTFRDTRQSFYSEPYYGDGDAATSGGWVTVGSFFQVDSPSLAVGRYFSRKDASPFQQQARALGKAYRDVLMRQNPLPESAFLDEEASTYGRARDYHYDYTGPGLVYSQRCKNPFEVAGKLLSQVNQPRATNQAQEILVELSAMSLAAAGFSGFANTVEGQQVFGGPKGFNGRQLPKWKRLFVHKDVKPVRVARHLALLNEVKAQGGKQLEAQLQTPIEPYRLTDAQYAEQLIHRGKMVLICAPTEALHQHAEDVHRLAKAVDAVDVMGLRQDTALTKRSPEMVALVDALNEAAKRLFPTLRVNGVAV